MTARPVQPTVGGVSLDGDLAIPAGAVGLVVFAHGSGSSRHSPRNRAVAARLHEAGLAALLLDLLTPEEEDVDLRTRELRFDIDLLAERLAGALAWCRQQPDLAQLPMGLFGASTGGGPRCLPPHGTLTSSWRSCPAAAGPIWPEPRCRSCAPPCC